MVNQSALPPPVAEAALTAYRTRQIELLDRWAKDPKAGDLEDDVISTVALMRAVGGFHYLGDIVLLAWRCASSDEMANVLAWYLENRVPTVGFNGLPKKALQYLSENGQRKLLHG